MRKPMNTKLAVFKETVALSGATIIAQILTLFLAVYIRRVLGPEAIGVWALLQVISSYLTYVNLGIVNAIKCEIPTIRGQGQGENAIQHIRDAGFTYLSIVALATSAVLVISAFALRSALSDFMFYGLLVLAALTLLKRSNNYLLQLLYVEKKFTLASRFKIYSAFVNVILVVILSWKYHIYGFFAAQPLYSPAKTVAFPLPIGSLPNLYPITRCTSPTVKDK